MPSLDAIITEINRQVQTVLGGPVYGRGKYFGLAVSLPRNTTDGTDYMPCVVTNDDEETWVGVDDDSPIIIYHKNNGISTDLDEKSNFGRPGDAVIEVASLQMVVFGDRKQLQISPEDLYVAIVSGIQQTFPKSFIEPYLFKSLNISGLNPNFNSIALYSQEYKVNTYPLKPNNIFFSISYKVTTRYNKSCVPLCS